MKNKLHLCLICCYLSYSNAQDLGNIGKTYEIGEQSLLEVMQNKAKHMVSSGQWDRYQKQVIKNTENKVDNPPAIMGISKTTQNTSRYFDASVLVTQDIINPINGSVIAKKGTRLNPAKFKPFNNELVFIDGRDKEQINFALGRVKKSKFPVSIILVAGKDYRKLVKETQQKFYYDQNAKLTTKFSITHVPSIVYQDDLKPEYLRIDEVVL